MAKTPRNKAPRDEPAGEPDRALERLALEFAAFKDRVVAEVTSIRMTLIAQGIRPPPSALDDGAMSVSEYAKANCISREGVLTRIRRRQLSATKRGGRWRIDLHGLNRDDGHPGEAVGLEHDR